MREIKFRAFHYEKKIMANVGDLNWSGKVHVTYKQGPEKTGYFFGGNNVGDDWDKNDFALMQFTGLKDKNKVEIYEGDILKGDHSPSSRKPTQVNDVVIWRGVGWKRKSYNGEMEVYPDLNCRSMEVIGNIYENPELLTQ